MSTFRRIMSFLLALIMLVGLLPAGAAAAEADDMTMEGTNSLGALLSEEIQAQQEASAAANEAYGAAFSVTDLTFSGATATVTYDAAEEATLVVAVYTEDGMTLLNSAYTQVSPGQTQATVTLSGEMPKFFAASAYLLNTYDLSPLCPAYDTPVYTQSMQELLSSTVEDYPEERVLNLDEDNTTNFVVYAEGTVVIEEQAGVNTVLSADDESMTYVIGNADAQFTSLQVGDVVVYPYGEGQYIIVKAASISVSGTTVTISGGELDVEDVFSHVKIEGDSSNAEVTYDDSTLSEGLSVAPSAGPSSTDISATGTVSKEYNLFDNGTVSGTLGFQLSVTVNYYAVDDVCHLELRDDAQITLNAQFSGEYSDSMCLGRFGVAFVYGAIYVGLEPTVNFSAEAEAEFTGTVSAMVGARVESDRGAFAISEAPKASYDLRVEGSVYLGLDLNPTLEILGGVLADGDLTLAVGVRIDGELTGGITSGSTEEIEPEDTIHTCEACIDLNGYCQLDFQAAVQFFRQPALTFSTEEHQKDIHLGQWYYSVDQDEFDEGECPYKSHRVSIEVLDSDGISVSGAAVEVSQAEQVEENGYTGGNGVYSVYLTEGSHTIRAVHGELRRTVTENVTEPGKVTITLPENPEEEPEETPGDTPEGTQPSFPGEVLEDLLVRPVGQAGRLSARGIFELNGMQWSVYQYKIDDKTYFGKLVITGSGEINNEVWSSAKGNLIMEDGRIGQAYTPSQGENEIVFGNGITSITDLTIKSDYVTLPSTLRVLGDYVFHNNSRIAEITLPEGLTYLGEGVFMGCRNLKELVIPGSVQEIGTSAVGGSGIEQLVIQNGVTELVDFAIETCTKLKSVTLPSSLKKMGQGNFSSCTSLRQVNLPEGLEVLGPGCFYESDLRQVSIPASLRIIGDSCFNNCDSLESVVIPSTVTEMGEEAFGGCDNLKSLVILGGGPEIGERAFYGHQSLERVVLGEGVTKIGTAAFQSCAKLQSVQLPNTLEVIGESAFDRSGLPEITIPGSVQEIGSNAFLYCDNLEKVTVLPGVECIGRDAFQHCTALTDLVLPEGLKKIDHFAFFNCDSLTELTIPKTVEYIGEQAFGSCENLESITFEGFDLTDEADYGITLCANAFEYCAAARLELPAIVSMANSPFNNCSSLETIAIDGWTKGRDWSHNFPNSVQTVYYPYTYSLANYPGDGAENANLYYTVSCMEVLGRSAEWIPYTVDDAGNMVPMEELAYRPDRDWGNHPFALSAETNDNAEEYAETTPTETEPAVTEPAETVVETLPAETVAETIPEETVEETVPMETEPVETIETLQEETASFVSVALPTPAGANTFRVGKPRAEIRSLSNDEITVGEEITAPALDALFGGEYSSEVTEDKTVKTASFSELVPGEEYLLLALTTLDTTDPLSIDNLIHIDQGTAAADGTLAFRYVERQDFPVSYVMVSGPSSKNLQDADITFPRVFANGEEQVIRPTVVYGGKILTEEKDYTLSGKVAFRAAGTYTCYIQGIYDYTGTVECTYEVLPCQKHTPGPAATCTTAQLCTVCKAELKAALGHDEMIDAAVAPTCTENGLTEGSHCERCGEIFAAQERIPATGHSFENGFCTICGASDKADFNLFAGKNLTLKPINPETNKAYTAKQLEWSMDEAYEPFVKQSKGKVTAYKVVEKARVEVVAKVVATGEEIPYVIDVFPAVTQVEVKKGEEIVNGKTLLMDVSEESLTLKVDTYPLDTLEEVTWTISDAKKQQYATYEINGDTLTIANPKGKAGTVTVKATVNAGVKKTVTVKVQFGIFAEEVKLFEPATTTLRGGESLKLSAYISKPVVVTKPGLVWTTSDKNAATVSNGTVKAKNVAHPTLVTITATSKDGQASASVKLKIVPKNEGQLVIMQDGAYATNSTHAMNVGDTYQVSASRIENGQPVSENVTWTSSKDTVATVENGLITAVGAGSAKITAECDGMKAVINVKVSTLVADMAITTKDGKNIIDENEEKVVLVSSGKSVNLVANVLTAGANRTVTWEITEGANYAKIATSGKLTANKDLTSVQYITVKATAKDGSGTSATIKVKLLPLATGVQIFQNGTRVRSNTVFVYDIQRGNTLKLSAKVYPAKANQAVQLTSSSKKIADFNENGELVCFKTGTVTITAKALDGSNTKTTFKLTIVKKVTDLSLKEGSVLTVVGGKTLKLAPMIEISPSDATNKKLNWKVSDNDFGIKISSSGVLSTKKVTRPVTVNIMVTPQDGSGKMLSFDVTVNPA